MSAADVEKVNAFHKHLDTCKQCADHPFALCRIGAVLLKYEATKPEPKVRP